MLQGPLPCSTQTYISFYISRQAHSPYLSSLFVLSSGITPVMAIPGLASCCPCYQTDLTCELALQAPRIILDGPFGAPAQEHSSFRTIVLIGMGIGITPMLSIMRDTLHNLAALPRNPTGLEVRPCD